MSEFLSRLGGAALNDLKGTPLDKILNHLMGGQQGASGGHRFLPRASRRSLSLARGAGLPSLCLHGGRPLPGAPRAGL